MFLVVLEIIRLIECPQVTERNSLLKVCAAGRKIRCVKIIKVLTRALLGGGKVRSQNSAHLVRQMMMIVMREREGGERVIRKQHVRQEGSHVIYANWTGALFMHGGGHTKTRLTPTPPLPSSY
jgi:hypothetical protein